MWAGAPLRPIRLRLDSRPTRRSRLVPAHRQSPPLAPFSSTAPFDHVYWRSFLILTTNRSSFLGFYVQTTALTQPVTVLEPARVNSARQLRAEFAQLKLILNG